MISKNILAKKLALKNIAFQKTLEDGISWYIKGWDLYNASKRIRKSHPNESSLLVSYAFELILKSYYISEKKLSGTALPKTINTHNLNLLKSTISSFGQKDKSYNNLFTQMEEFITWRGRYPIPLNSQKYKIHASLNFTIVDQKWKRIHNINMPLKLKLNLKQLILSVKTKPRKITPTNPFIKV